MNQISLSSIISLFIRVSEITYRYYYGIYYYTLGDGRTLPFENSNPHQTTTLPLNDNHQKERIHLYNIASNIYLYHRIHYRKDSYKKDLYDNLQNVAIPGTGIKLSYYISHITIVPLLLFLLIIYPKLSFISAIHYYYDITYVRKEKNNNNSNNTNSQQQEDNATTNATTSSTSTTLMIDIICEEYTTRLLRPDDWFTYWRLNSIIVGMHSYLYRHDVTIQHDYSMENKWKFLQYGKEKNIPISPYLEYPEYVMKHKNEEGGLGIHFYKNAVHDGDWIIQERIYNNDFVNTLLPSQNPPLSTFRIITCSKPCYYKTTKDDDMIIALSCVFRAGRANALTDHSSILFDVDMKTGMIQGGTTNSNWYQLGLSSIWKCPWRSYDEDRMTHHPDEISKQLAGILIPQFTDMIQLCIDSHKTMCPSVPFAGWDVVCTNHPNMPLCLLEVNLSCNFFRGTFDEKIYYDFIDQVFTTLQKERINQENDAYRTTNNVSENQQQEQSDDKKTK